MLARLGMDIHQHLVEHVGVTLHGAAPQLPRHAMSAVGQPNAGLFDHELFCHLSRQAPNA